MVDVPEVSTTSPSELIAAGRRHLAVKDYHAATEALATACEQLAKEHGEVADECAEAYLWYGQALLGLSREENGVLGDGMPGANNADEDDEENEEDEEENGDEKENGDGKESGEEEKAEDNGEEKKAEVVEKIEAESTTEDAEPGPSEDNADEQPGTSNGETHDESVVDLENKDEIDNLQLAWEMLDLARNILEKRAEGSAATETKALLADVHLYLGEVALESETYDKAVTDMLTCLEIQKDLYGLDNRRIAETHYQIGLANSLASNFEDAILHFKNAANILETRIKTLESPNVATEDVSVKKYSANDPLYSIEGEIKELKSLLPEIQEKIQDMMDYKAETKKRLAETLCPSNGSSSFSGSNGSGSGAGSSSDKPAASDISHLIKRKRKNSEETASPAKRLNA